MVCLSVNGSSMGCFEGDSPNGALIPIKDVGTARVTGLCWTPAGRAVASPPLNVDIVIPISVPVAEGVVDPVRGEDAKEENDEDEKNQVMMRDGNTLLLAVRKKGNSNNKNNIMLLDIVCISKYYYCYNDYPGLGNRSIFYIFTPTAQ